MSFLMSEKDVQVARIGGKVIRAMPERKRFFLLMSSLSFVNMFSRKTCCLLFLSLSLPILISNSTTANFFLVPRGRESRIGKKRFIAISVLVRSNQNHPKENTEKSNIDVEMPFFPPKTFLAQIYDPFRVFHQNSDFCRFLLILQEWSSVFVNGHWGACKLVSSSHSSLEIHFQIFELMSIMPFLEKKGKINGQFERASNISQILKVLISWDHLHI